MPRELGKAKRTDLSGHFPGEQAEYGSALARFLEGAGQLKPVSDGTYLDTVSGNGNGNGASTEIPRNQTEVPTRSSDTEVAPAPESTKAGGNGQHSDNGSDTLFDTAFDQDDMFPEPAFEPEPLQAELLEPAGDELQPVSFEPSAATLHPDAVEPEALDSVPDLTSPELDTSYEDSGDEGDEEEYEDDEDEEEEVDTDILERKSSLPTVSPHTDELPVRQSVIPQSSGDTGILEPEDIHRVSDEDRINFDELSPSDEDETGVLPEEAESERITSKVEPRRDVDPRAADPNAVVRDTVNFYNQTQSLYEKKKDSGGFPTISPKVVNSTQPLGLRPDSLEQQEDTIAPDLFSEDESETDTLKPGPASEIFSEQGDSLSLDPVPAFGEEAEPALTSVGSEAETRIVHALPLEAESDLDDADKRETDKFNEDDRRPPPLPQPEGTDKLDKDQMAIEKAATVAGEPQGLEPLGDEKVASGKDTQRFYVAEILAKSDSHTGDTTAELQPAQEGPPQLEAPSDTSLDYPTGTERKSVETRREPKPEPLPSPSEVNTDFKLKPEPRASERIVPEIESDQFAEEFEAGFEPGPDYEPSLLGSSEEDERDGDDTVDEEATSALEDEPAAVLDVAEDVEERKITEKVKRDTRERRARDTDEYPSVPEPVRASRRAETASSARVQRITDSLSQRLKKEREETLRLIEQAESVALKLREASEQSRTDLVALSARRSAVRNEMSEAIDDPQDDHAGTDLEELPQASESESTLAKVTPLSAHRTESEDVSVHPRQSRRAANRVPTSAIGELIAELERTAQSAPVSLTELLNEVSRRQEATVTDASDEEEDVDVLVAASSRWREILADDHADDHDEEDLEAEHDDDDRPSRASSVRVAKYSRRSGRARLIESEFDTEPAAEPEREPEPPSRPAATSTLASDLDRLWEVLDSRRTATVVMPASERTRVAPQENEIWEGWTQEMLWPTLAGIAGVTFALGALFIWVLMKWAA
ncbi:MAG: hypothetical protein KDB32_03890 [Planctomycetes bacterium]|nr:hypothetical protein [Planctomycetota bacterium]